MSVTNWLNAYVFYLKVNANNLDIKMFRQRGGRHCHEIFVTSGEATRWSKSHVRSDRWSKKGMFKAFYQCTKNIGYFLLSLKIMCKLTYPLFVLAVCESSVYISVKEYVKK